MKRGRTSWTVKAPEALVQRVREALVGGRASARELYEQHNVQRYVRLSTFEHWCAVERRANAARKAGATDGLATDVDPAPAGTLLDRALDAVGDAMLRGDAKLYELGGVVRALVTLEQLRLSENADRRAAEKHTAWQNEYRAQQDAALRELSDRLTPEQVAEIRLKVLGL